MAVKASKVAGWVFFAVVAVLTVAVLLPTFGVVDNSDCTRTSEASNISSGEPITAELLQGVALQVRSNDAALGQQLQSGGAQGAASNSEIQRQLSGVQNLANDFENLRQQLLARQNALQNLGTP